MLSGGYRLVLMCKNVPTTKPGVNKRRKKAHKVFAASDTLVRHNWWLRGDADTSVVGTAIFLPDFITSGNISTHMAVAFTDVHIIDEWTLALMKVCPLSVPFYFLFWYKKTRTECRDVAPQENMKHVIWMMHHIAAVTPSTGDVSMFLQHPGYWLTAANWILNNKKIDF